MTRTRIGIFGSAADPQCDALRRQLTGSGAEVLIVDSQGLNRGSRHAFDGERFVVEEEDLRDVGCWFLRHVMSPMPPAFGAGEDYHLFADWLVEYMHRRERFGFQLSMLLASVMRGIPVVNPPENGTVVQLKPLQLAAARNVGLEPPRTLITNDPEAARAFRAEHERVVFKPSMGGGLCVDLDDAALEHVDLIARAPVTFQERVDGVSIRATFLGDELVSCVAVPSRFLDFREDPTYQAGDQRYEPFELPSETAERCRLLLRHCGLLFSGVDFIQREDGSLAFLEANSSPIYLDVEQKTGVPITARLAEYLLRLAREPDQGLPNGRPATRKSFVDYALPFAPDRTVHSPAARTKPKSANDPSAE